MKTPETNADHPPALKRNPRRLDDNGIKLRWRFGFHLVVREGNVVNDHPCPRAPWNASPRDIYGLRSWSQSH